MIHPENLLFIQQFKKSRVELSGAIGVVAKRLLHRERHRRWNIRALHRLHRIHGNFWRERKVYDDVVAAVLHKRAEILGLRCVSDDELGA